MVTGRGSSPSLQGPGVQKAVVEEKKYCSTLVLGLLSELRKGDLGEFKNFWSDPAYDGALF